MPHQMLLWLCWHRLCRFPNKSYSSVDEKRGSLNWGFSFCLVETLGSHLMGSVFISCSASLEPCLIDEDFVTETLLKGDSTALSPKASLSSPPRRAFPRLDFTASALMLVSLLLPCVPWDLPTPSHLSLQKGLQVLHHICSLAELCSLP